MFNKISNKIIAVILAVSSIAVSAEDVYLLEPVKEQSGFYLVQPDYVYNFSMIVPSTGVALEIYNAGEEHNVYHYSLPSKYLFGAYFNSNGDYITLQGSLAENSLTRFNVDLVYTSLGISQVVGHGTVHFDHLNRGNSHTVRFDFLLVNGNTYFDGGSLGGVFRRISGVTIKACLPYSTLPETVIDPEDYVNCVK